MRRRAESSFYGFDLQDSTRLLVAPGGSVTDAYVYQAFGVEPATGGTRRRGPTSERGTWT